MATPHTPPAAIPGNAPRAAWPGLLLMALLLVLAVRLTLSETVRLPIKTLVAAALNKDLPQPFTPGPAVTIGFFVAVLAIAAAAALVGNLSRRHGLTLALVLGAGGCLAASVLGAENRFAALVGSCDLATGLVAAWAASVLARQDRARRLVVCALVAVLAVWTARGLFQYFIEFPDLIDYYNAHKEETLAMQGITPGSPAETTFWYRLHSREVFGFISFANVMAGGLIGLITLAAALPVAALVFRRPSAEAAPVQEKRPARGRRPEPARAEVPLLPLLLIAAATLLVLAVTVLSFTGSKGGLAATAFCVVLLAAGFAFRQILARLRWGLLVCALAAGVCGVAAVTYYGNTHDALPGKSMLFRWHYWTGAAPVIAAEPLTGVGLHNFGDYYLQEKRPSSPEDVKDPHAFFVRLAAEAGIPATALVGVLILALVVGAMRPRRDAEDSPAPTRALMLAGAAFCVLWFALRYPLAESANLFETLMALIYAAIGFAGFALAAALLDHATPRGLRAVMLALLLGAVGMLLYDQINMALVTGPVAMLFWVMLGAAAAEDETDPPLGGALVPRLAGGVLGAAALGTAAVVLVPVAAGGFAWDPTPNEKAFVTHRIGGDLQAALADLDDVIRRTPRSGEAIRARIDTKLALKLPAADDIRRLLDLDRANARIRVELASLESDMPAHERAEILERALWLDTQLPPREAKGLTPAEREGIRAKIATLRATPATSLP